MRFSIVSTMLITALSSTNSLLAQDYPPEAASLITAYSVGKLSTMQLLAACIWATKGVVDDEGITVIRQQNIAFCDGYLGAITDYVNANQKHLSCSRDNSSGEPREQFLSNLRAIRSSDSMRADEFVLTKIHGCSR